MTNNYRKHKCPYLKSSKFCVHKKMNTALQKGLSDCLFNDPLDCPCLNKLTKLRLRFLRRKK